MAKTMKAAVIRAFGTLKAGEIDGRVVLRMA